MNLVNKIWNHPIYQREYNYIVESEKDWIFCGHDIEHFLDVARLMQIYNQAENLNIEKNIIYAAALLHDIGRGVQSRTGEGHHKASARLAEEIMRDCGFTDGEIDIVKKAISLHRGKEKLTESEDENFNEEDKILIDLLYRADKKSRNCFACKSAKECNWPIEKRNLKIID